MRISMKLAIVAAAVAVLGLAAQAQAGGIVFWGGSVAVSRPVVVQQVVVPARAPVVVYQPTYYAPAYAPVYYTPAYTPVYPVYAYPVVRVVRPAPCYYPAHVGFGLRFRW